MTRPRKYLFSMVGFVLFVAMIAALMHQWLTSAFLFNAPLNGMILGVLFIGIIYIVRRVLILYPEVEWIERFRRNQPGLSEERPPRLLAPMATMLGERKGRLTLSAPSMRSLLDGISSRLDEARDIARYLVGVLIFLGLLGTFWGLIETIVSIKDVIRGMSVGTGDVTGIFTALKENLEGPLAGMGTSFSSSLFGLAGSLVLGFLDLQASQAQNRFYNELEEWLSSITDIAASDSGQLSVPQYLRMDMSNVQRGIERMNATLETALAETDAAPRRDDVDSAALDKLAGAVEDLVHQMREEHRMVRQLARSQAEQNAEMRRAITGQTRPAAPTAASGRLRASVRPPRRPED